MPTRHAPHPGQKLGHGEWLGQIVVGPGLHIAGRKNAELCQDGPYSLVRNPLHAFSFVGALGIALATHRRGLTPLVALLFLGYHHLVVKSEETRLAALARLTRTGHSAPLRPGG